MIGEVIQKKYRIIDQIGQGSLAAVYLARDLSRDQVVALKVIRPEWAAEGRFLQRFQQEARLLQMLSAPQVIKVLDYGEHGELAYVVQDP